MQQVSLWNVLPPIVEKKQAVKTKDEIDAFLLELARNYNKATRNYRNAICSGSMVDGERVPATSIEAKFIGRHTRMMLQQAHQQANDGFGLAPSVVNAAIRDHKDNCCHEL